jgi:hypothetical protein
LTRHILPKSPLAPLCQRGEFLPLAKGGEEGFSLKRLYNYGLINKSPPAPFINAIVVSTAGYGHLAFPALYGRDDPVYTGSMAG